ncbi:MAG: hypothetical protein KDA85_07020, partial [Planctomycetaceae bacterium]|nr:hypothetical protein [Planctomycetaceae bacterium]
MNRSVVALAIALTTLLKLDAFAQDLSRVQGLTNPSFEEPRGNEKGYKFVESMPGWKTTDSAFEIWGTGFNEVDAYDGDQFVELNAKIDGTLYQDATGIKAGSVLEFTFAHRGRFGKDTMKLT